MRFFPLIGYALTTAVILAGCSGSGGSQGTNNPPTAQNPGGSTSSTQNRDIAARTLVARRGLITGSHRHLVNQNGVGAVYVSDVGVNTLFGYALTGGSPTYTVATGLNEPQGLASTATKVYLANTGDSQILVFTPPSTTPATINDSGEFPSGVAVNAAGSQVWVTNICSAPSCGQGNLQEYNGSGNLIQTITCANLYRYYFVGIDTSGNVAVDGEDASDGIHVDFIPAGSTTCTPLTSIIPEFPGGLEFTSAGNLAVDDQDANTVTTWTAPSFTSSSSTTSLSGISDPVTFGFGAGQTTLWTANAGSASATQFPYTAGGSPTVTITSGLEEPIGVTVTGKSKCKGKDCKQRNRPAEIFNFFEPYPCIGSAPCPTNFEVVFDGNLTSSIPTNEPVYGPYNPFCPAGQGPNNPCPPTVTYNSSTTTPCGTTSATGYTTVTYAGTTLNEGNSPSEPYQVHFGLLASQNQTTWLNDLCAYFTYNSSPPLAQPIVSINSTQPATSTNWKYALVYYSGSTSPSGSYQYATWNEFAYDPGTTDASGQPKVTFENYGTQTIYTLNSGIILDLPVPVDEECQANPACPENMELLGSLDEAGYAPPDSSGSEFMALQTPPKRVLKPHK